MSDIPNKPINRYEQYLNAIATGDASDLPTPITREELYLNYIAENGTSKGGSYAILGSYDTLAELKAAHPTGNAGDAYLIGDPAHIYVWLVKEEEWSDGGPFTAVQGPKGDKGDKGDTGEQGPKGDTGAAGKDGTPIYNWTPDKEWKVNDLCIYNDRWFQCTTTNSDATFNPAKWHEIGNADGNYSILDDANFDEEHPNDYLPQGYGPDDRKMVYVVQTKTFWLWTGISWDEQLQKVITKAKIDALFD